MIIKNTNKKITSESRINLTNLIKKNYTLIATSTILLLLFFLIPIALFLKETPLKKDNHLVSKIEGKPQFTEGIHYVKTVPLNDDFKGVRFYFSMNSESSKEAFILLNNSSISGEVDFIHSVFSEEHNSYAKLFTMLKKVGLSNNKITPYFTQKPFSEFKEDNLKKLIKDGIDVELFFSELDTYATTKKALDFKIKVIDKIKILPEIYINNNLLVLGSFETFTDVVLCIEELLANNSKVKKPIKEQ
jgi:hypothetical protein